MKRILMIGGSGTAGANICQGLRQNFEIFAASKDRSPFMLGVKPVKINLLDKDNIKRAMAITRPDLMIYAGGYHGLPQGAESTQRGEIANNICAVNFVEMAERNMTPCVYLSNAYAVGHNMEGLNREIITPDTPCSPESQYGKSKLQAENFYLTRTKVGYVLRTGIFVGRGSGLNLGWWEAMEKALTTGVSFRLRTDVMHSWTDLNWLAPTIEKIFETQDPEHRCIQLAAEGVASPYEMVEKYATAIGANFSKVEKLHFHETEDIKWSGLSYGERVLSTYNIEAMAKYELDVKHAKTLVPFTIPTIDEMMGRYTCRWDGIWRNNSVSDFIDLG